MRHSIILVLLFLAGAFFWMGRDATSRGSLLREQERGAARVLLAIMQAEEERRQGPDGERLFAYLSELIAGGKLAGFRQVPDQPRRELFEKDGYLFCLRLLDEGGVPYALMPEDDIPETFGNRYDVWAWPAHAERLSQVLYFASNAGYLLQRENGVVAGPLDVPPEENLLRRWDILQREERLRTFLRPVLNLRRPARWPDWIKS